MLAIVVQQDPPAVPGMGVEVSWEPGHFSFDAALCEQHDFTWSRQLRFEVAETVPIARNRNPIARAKNLMSTLFESISMFSAH